MKPLALAAAAAGAIIAVAGCSHPAPSAAPAKHVSVTHSAKLVNCPVAYSTWKRGPARRVVAALATVDSAIPAGDTPALTVALKQAGPAVLRAARYPIPACADPKGYWTALLMHVNAAASSSGSASGSTASVRAALRGVPRIERELSAELKSTAGVK
jgi:hypothetical protein